MSQGCIFERIKDADEDLNSLYELRSGSADIYWSGYVSRPDPAAFKTWFDEQLPRTDRNIWLVREIGNPAAAVGYLYVTYSMEDKKKIAFISHGVAGNSTGKGIGSTIVNFVVNMAVNGCIETDELQAWVVRENIASAKTFIRNGFVKSSRQKEEFYKSMDKRVTMDNYFFKIRL